MLNKKSFFLPFLFLFFFDIYAIDKNITLSKLPVLPSLSSRDDLFREYTSIVDDNYKLLAAGQEPLTIFFKCRVPADTNLIALAARCNIPYETIATLNHIGSNEGNLEGREIIISTTPGLFINPDSQEQLQIILQSRFGEILQNENVCYNFGTEKFIFLQNERFNPTERAYFLDTTMGLPIDTSLCVLSSPFGKRQNPFSGEWKNHKGIDLAAKKGTPVCAVKSGTIALVQQDPTFGLYIILKHDNGDVTSVYAHLSASNVKKGNRIKRGDVIGYVGDSGMATGPHLHFEIRFGGIAEDPEKLLPVKQRK